MWNLNVLRWSLIIHWICMVGCSIPSTNSNHIHDAEVLTSHAKQYLQIGLIEEAKAAFEYSWELYPNPEALDGLGCIKVIQRDLSGAKRIFENITLRFPNYSSVKRNLGVLSEVEGDSVSAISYYNEALKADPSDAMARNNLAVIEYEFGEDIPRTRLELVKSKMQLPEGLPDKNLDQLDR